MSIKEKKKEDRALKRRKTALLWRFLKGSKAFFLLSVFSAAMIALCDMVQPQIIRIAVDNIICGKEPELSAAVLRIVDRLGGFEYLGKHMWIVALAVIVVSLVQVTCQYGFRVFNTYASETLVKTMRDSLFSRIERLPFSWHMKNKTGDIIQRCTSDIDTIKQFISEQLTNVFRITILLVLSIVFMLSMNVSLTLIALIPIPIVICYSLLFHRKIHEGFTACDENEGKLSAMAQENLTGVRVVRAFGRERSEVDKFTKHNAYYTSLWVKMAKTMTRFWSSADIISGLEVFLVVVFGAWFCVRGELSEGEYIAFISYNSLLVWPVRMLGRMISEMSKAGVSIDRVFFIMDTPEESDAPDAVDAPMNGDISFENVSFSYDEGAEVLHDISFTLKAGQTLGILGGTGSGKSTMMLLLDKLYELPENCGRITIGGVDIRKIRTAHLRSNIGMVLQEPYLFSRTLGENIGIASPDADLEAIRSAASAAALDESIMSFSQGYETQVGERGVTLSGGQKQRTAIARMLIKPLPIMILDDSLSAVDTETDAKIRHAFSERFGNSSVILISHRITTLSSAHLILVLDKGRIAEMGSPEELLEKNGIYKKIYDTQNSNAEEAIPS